MIRTTIVKLLATFPINLLFSLKQRRPERGESRERLIHSCRIVTFCVLLLSAIFAANAQTYTGKVIDGKSKEVLEAVSVILLGTDHSPVAFIYTDAAGVFSLPVPKDTHPVEISFSMLGYDRNTIPLSQYKNGQTVGMEQKTFQIKEVKVTAQRIRQQHDTLTYSVAGFRQKQDRSIADVIAKMPGMEVKQNGMITFQGKAINKFYIEGMDLLGSQYAQASENLSADKVKNVQVLQNHQPVKALRKIDFSEQAALNIVLKEDAKNTWNGVADVGMGTSLQEGADWLRDCRLVEMMFGGKKQNISMYKCNNTGKDIQHELRDLTRVMRSLEDENGILSPLSVGAPALDDSRYSFNDTHLFATNWLFKANKDNDLRLQLNVILDKSKLSQHRETFYTDVDNGALITEESSAVNRRSEWKGEVMYKVNKDQFYLNNTLRGYADFNKSEGISDLNGSEVEQLVKPRKRYITDDFELVRTMKGDKSFSLSSQMSYNYLPGMLLLSDASKETLNLHTLQWDTYSFFRHRLAGMYITYKAGFSTRTQDMQTYNREASADDEYREYRWYLTPSVNFTRDGLKIIATAPFSWLSRSYGDKSKKTLLVEPSLKMNYEATAKTTASVGYSYNWQPTDLKGISATPVYTNYITVLANSGDLEKTMSHNLYGSLQYTDPIKGFFANCYFNYFNRRHTPLYESTLTDEIYRRKATGEYTNSETYMLNGRISQAWGWSKLSVALTGMYSWDNYKLLFAGALNPYQMRTSSVGVEFSFRPVALLSFEENSSYDYSKQINKANPSLSTDPLRSFYHKLKTFILPGKWQIEWDNECYHSNDKTVSFNFFSDLSVFYRAGSYEVGLSCNNIFGNTQYERRMITTNQQVYTINQLRPRELLCKVSFNL